MGQWCVNGSAVFALCSKDVLGVNGRLLPLKAGLEMSHQDLARRYADPTPSEQAVAIR